jgi:hypothetical protein
MSILGSDWRKHPELVRRLKEGAELIKQDEEREKAMNLLRGIDQM